MPSNAKKREEIDWFSNLGCAAPALVFLFFFNIIFAFKIFHEISHSRRSRSWPISIFLYFLVHFYILFAYSMRNLTRAALGFLLFYFLKVLFVFVSVFLYLLNISWEISPAPLSVLVWTLQKVDRVPRGASQSPMSSEDFILHFQYLCYFCQWEYCFSCRCCWGLGCCCCHCWRRGYFFWCCSLWGGFFCCSCRCFRGLGCCRYFCLCYCLWGFPCCSCYWGCTCRGMPELPFIDMWKSFGGGLWDLRGL